MVAGNLNHARDGLLNFYWLKLGPHELLFDRIQYGRDQMGKVKKGMWAIEDESEGWKTLTGIRNRIVNVIRFGEELQEEYIEHLDKPLPGFSRKSKSTFLSSFTSSDRPCSPLHSWEPLLLMSTSTFIIILASRALYLQASSLFRDDTW